MKPNYIMKWDGMISVATSEFVYQQPWQINIKLANHLPAYQR